MIQRNLIPAVLALALLTGAWLLWQRATNRDRTAKPTALSMTATPAPRATPTLQLAERVSAFRLAGTAVGDPVSYAAIETVDGVSQLYRSDEIVPGLGRIVAIATDHVVVVGTDGAELELRLRPAATPTRDRRRLNPTPTAAGADLTPTALPALDDTPPGSRSSVAPDRPAS